MSASRSYGTFAGILLLVLGFGLLLSAGLRNLSQKSVVSVDVDSSFKQVKAAALQPILESLVGQKMLDVDLPKISNGIAGLDWVREVSVYRRWPDRVAVEIWEHEPFAIWGEAETLTRRGEVLAYAPPMRPNNQAWPVLSGPQGSAAEVLNTFAEHHAKIAAMGAELAGLEKNRFNAWVATLSNGSKINYGRNLAQRQERVALAWPVLNRGEQEVASVDLRYSNGFAVRWQSAESKQDVN